MHCHDATAQDAIYGQHRQRVVLHAHRRRVFYPVSCIRLSYVSSHLVNYGAYTLRVIMADECDVSEIVSTFLRYTSRLPPRPSINDVQAAIRCAEVAAEVAEFNPLVTGSIAEFYIEPLLPHVGDIDIMFYRSTHLAIPQGHPPPTQLPAAFNDYVYAHEIVESQFPGFVYLQLRYLLTQRVDDGKYENVEYDESDRYPLEKTWTNLDISTNTTIHGPALSTDRKYPALSTDLVVCVRCLSWPPQAADWPTRHRNHGWPDSATLGRVVSNGCDAVHVARRQCRQHECHSSKIQWRLSFSRAEIVLINSWMPVQQIVYHMLRVYVKSERLTESAADNAEPAVLSNYHIKTLMLWSCETKPMRWWSENVNLVRICVELVHTLSDWLSDSDTGCQHYFVNSPCNIADDSLNATSVAGKLMSINEEYLSRWLMNNYVKKCADICPPQILRLFDDASTSVKLQNAVSETVCWRLNTLLLDTWLAVDVAELCVPQVVSKESLTVRSCVFWLNELTKIDKRFSVYFSAVALLHVARRILTNGLCEELVDIMGRMVVVRSSNQWSSVLSRCTTDLNTSELVESLQKAAVEHLTTYRQVTARDFGSVATIVTTDFEALYAYKRGDYQRCLQLSTQNVHALLYAVQMPAISTRSEFIQLMDDDIVSLTGLGLLVDSESTEKDEGFFITQLTLSLYLMTQCQLKLRHSAASLAQTLDHIEVAQRRHPRWCTLVQLTLKYTARKIEIGLH